MTVVRRSRLLLVVIALVGAVAVGTATRAAQPARAAAQPARGRRVGGISARVLGTFAMVAHVTVATNVRGERVGEVLRRRWTIAPAHCHLSVCKLLRLDRVRSAHIHERLTLHRVGPGRYTGNGVFYAALSCNGQIYRYGSRVPFGITLTVRGAAKVEGIAFATRITATYDNPARTDSTPCPLGPSHDAARYAGIASTPVPTPPTASFTTAVDGRHDSATFRNTSRRGRGRAKIVSVRWHFGDPASGAANTSTKTAPAHRFSAPGTYSVTLVVTDANGLTGTSSQTVAAPGPPSAVFTATEQGATATFSFQDASRVGIGGAAIVAWHWDFGDPSSGAADTSSVESPSHTFSAPGSYPVTLTVTDANGFTNSTTQSVIYPP